MRTVNNPQEPIIHYVNYPKSPDNIQCTQRTKCGMQIIVTIRMITPGVSRMVCWSKFSRNTTCVMDLNTIHLYFDDSGV